MKKAIFTFLSSILLLISSAQEGSAPAPVIFIYDASGSMWGQMEGKTKKEIAAEVLTNSIDGFPEEQKIGFVAYGHREKGDCEDVEFIVDVEGGAKTAVKEAIKDINPLGRTPLAYSASLVIEKLKNTGQKATIILITDGIESCGGNICDVIKDARKAGIDFKLHIIGFGLEEGDTQQLECAAKAGGGNYYDANNAGGLGDVLAAATAKPVDEPEPNFSVYVSKNGQPVDGWVKAQDMDGKHKPKLLRTYRDTAYMYLPPNRYNLEARPLEGSDVAMITVANVEIFEDRLVHESISFDAAKIVVNTTNNGEEWDAAVNVISLATGKNAARGRTYGRSKQIEVSPGSYNVELKALGIKGSAVEHVVSDLKVKSGETASISHNFESGTAMIGVQNTDGLVDATVKIIDLETKKNVASGRTYTGENTNPKEFVLSPGSYEVIVKVVSGANKGATDKMALTISATEVVKKIKEF